MLFTFERTSWDRNLHVCNDFLACTVLQREKIFGWFLLQSGGIFMLFSKSTMIDMFRSLSEKIILDSKFCSGRKKLIFSDFHVSLHCFATRKYFEIISFAKNRARSLLFKKYRHLGSPRSRSRVRYRLKMWENEKNHPSHTPRQLYHEVRSYESCCGFPREMDGRR